MRHTSAFVLAVRPSIGVATRPGPGPELGPARAPRLHRRRTADRLSRAHAFQRTARLQRGGQDHPQRHRPGLLRCRRQGRSGASLGLRAPVRAHDVQVHPRHAVGGHGPADRGRGRVQQRLNRRRLHRLFRGDPRQPPGAAAVGGGGAHERSAGRSEGLRVRTRRGGGGAAPARAGRPLWPALFADDPGGVVSGASVQAAGDRQHRRPGTPPAFPTCRPSTPPTTAPTTPT